MTDQAQIVHHIPGRMRLKFPRAKGNQILLAQIQQSIAPLPGVKRVEANSVTGSVLVHYQTGEQNDFLHQLGGPEGAPWLSLDSPVPSAADLMAAKQDAEAEFLAEQSSLGSLVFQSFERLNGEVKRGTQGMIDLKELFPFGLGIYSFFFIDWTIGAPLWLSVMFFSWDAFFDLHDPEPSQYVVGSVEALRAEIAALRGEVRALSSSDQGRAKRRA